MTTYRVTNHSFHRSIPARRPRTSLEHLAQMPRQECEALSRVTRLYPFRANDYYLSLIDWNDPADPIRRIIVPSEEELRAWGSLDPSDEQANTVVPGVQHKYAETALLLCSDVCGGCCRYCFRKRLFMESRDEGLQDLEEGLAYIAENPQISNVLLTGGDPLMLSTRRLVRILERLRAIPHVKIIRIGSKMPAFNPHRILDDEELLQALSRFSTPWQRIYLMAHFDHPRELTETAIRCIDRLIRAGVICCNQCPIIAGVNDDPQVLSELFTKLAWIGCPPYYLFQMRPTTGNQAYAVPIVRGWQVFQASLRQGGGLARRARFTMSHSSGKIEILAVDEDSIYMRYHRAKDPAMRGKFIIRERDDNAYWFDQLEETDCADSPRDAMQRLRQRMFIGDAWAGEAGVAFPN